MDHPGSEPTGRHSSPEPTGQYPTEPGYVTHSVEDWSAGPLIDDAPAYPALPVESERPRGSRHNGRKIIAAVAAAVVVVGGGGAAYAYTVLASGGTQPEHVLPRDTVAFAKLDLDPAADQKIAAYRLSRHFAGFAKSGNLAGVENGMLSSAFDGGSGLNFDTDVKPWLGDRIAVAAVPGPAGRLEAVTAIAITDKAKMTAAMAKERSQNPDFGYVTSHGYLLLTDTQADADALLPRIAKTSLADNTTYTGDVHSLAGHQLAVGWADLGAVAKAATAGRSSTFGTLGTAATTGRVVAGAHARSDYLELTGHSIGPAPTAKPIDDTLATLPDDTTIAVQVSGLGARLSQTYQTMTKTLGGRDPFSALLRGTGLRLPSDLVALFGSQTTLSVHEAADRNPPHYALQADEPATRANQILEALSRQFGGNALYSGIDSTARGYLVASDSDYADSITAGGRLGSTPAFTKAVPHAAGASLVGYFDAATLTRRFLASDADRARVSGIGALGISVNGSTFTVRLTTR